ncbi:copper transport protein ATOX1-like [Pomacea canaliculata]|uniref:copper transport protein ATOX1-like n=1 Tax=Pomacea canaliculata TaxID=400727 RepID=UPI000D72A6A6|nr:copper transport protein ATOX1-like [Pomacea canaliculata]
MASVFEFNMEMTCEGCANAAKKVLGKHPHEVTSVETDVGAQRVLVTSTLSSDQLLEILEKTGKKVSFVGKKQ